MGEQGPNLPAELREAIAGDLEPVRPLPPPWMRLLWAVPITAAFLVLPWVYFGVRPDLEHLGPMLAWVPVAMQVALGLALLLMALHEAVPGLGIPRVLVVGFCLVALGLHLAVNLLIYIRYPMGYDDFLASWWACFRYEFLLGVPFLIVITYLAANALPVRPRTVGLLSGVGGGVIADASWRMVCPVSAPLHFLTAHLGTIVVLGAAGYLLGYLYERHQTR